MPRQRFDPAYYRRFYEEAGTRVATPQSTARLANLVGAWLRHLQLPVRRILDAGCGTGLWQRPLGKLFPRASYTGIEVSSFLCRKFGWTEASVTDYQDRHGFDLLICQGVLQYLDDREVGVAMRNLGRLCRGAMYLEVLTQTDWDENCDQETTDGEVYLRPGSFYRRHLKRDFQNTGNGLFLHRDADVSLFELEALR